MDADEFQNWMAFDMLKDDKFKLKVNKARTADLDAEQYSMAIKQMFDSIRGSV